MELLSRQQQTAIIVLCCLFVIGITLFVRRLAGAFLHDLDAGEAALYACVFTTAVVTSVRSLQLEAVPREGTAGWSSGLILSLVFVAGISSDPMAVLTAIASVALVFGVAQRRAVPASTQVLFEASSPGDDSEPLAINADQPIPSGSRVSLIRSTERGTERIEGSMAIDFDAHELTKTLHVPLWPPLAAEPTVECRLDGLDGRIRVPLAKRHGFRIEVRLPEGCDEPLSGTLRFTATAVSQSAAA